MPLPGITLSEIRSDCIADCNYMNGQVMSEVIRGIQHQQLVPVQTLGRFVTGFLQGWRSCNI